MKTYTPKIGDIKRKWYLVDAKDQILGKLAVVVSNLLRGKNKPQFSSHLDVGDYVVVINSKDIKVTGEKLEDKKYYRYSGYPGGLKSLSLKEMMDRDPNRIVYLAVKGMLPKNRLAGRIIKKLKIYKDSSHPHSNQKLEEIKIN